MANDPINMSDALGLFFSSGGPYNPVQIDMLNTAICELFPEFCVDAAEGAGTTNGGGGDNNNPAPSCTMNVDTNIAHTIDSANYPDANFVKQNPNIGPTNQVFTTGEIGLLFLFQVNVTNI